MAAGGRRRETRETTNARGPATGPVLFLRMEPTLAVFLSIALGLFFP
jgi:hypothetical protein